PGSGWLDYARRLVAWTPSVAGQALVAAAVLLASLAARILANALVPGVTPFSALYPAILAATLLAGWSSGAARRVLGGLCAWVGVMDRPIFRATGAPLATADVANLGVYAVTAALLVLIVQAYRTSARRIAQADASRLDERKRTLDHVRELFHRAP